MATDISTQFVREAPEIEAQKLGLLQSSKALVDAANQAAMQGRFLTPSYQVAGFSPDQIQAMEAARAGIGAYQPYMSYATQAAVGGREAFNEAADVLRAADTRNQFNAARQALGISGLPIGEMAKSAEMVGQAAPMVGQGIGSLLQGAQLGLSAADMARMQGQQGIGTMYAAAEQARQAAQLGGAPMAQAAQTGFAPNIQAYQMAPAERVAAQQVGTPLMSAAQTAFQPNLQAFQMGPAERVATQTFAAPGSAESFMSPYMQNVVEIEKREAQRASDIAAQREGAQFARAGAFGGARQAIVEAERGRNLAQQMGDIQSRGLQSAFQQAQQQFNAEQAARLQANLANQQAGLTVGGQNLASQLGVQQLGTQTGLQTSLANLSASQQANVQNQAAQLQAQGMNSEQALRAALANQQAGLTVGQQNLASQQGAQQLGTQTGLQTSLANLSAQQQANLANQQMAGQYGLQGAQLGMQAADVLRQAGIGALQGAQGLGQLGLQGAGMLQSAGQGQIGAAGQLGQLGSQQANIYGQQSQLGQALAQGIGSLAGQQFGIGQNIAQNLGQYGTQQLGLSQQLAALGGQQQGLGQQDVNFLYNLGAQQQRQQQAVLDAQRQNTLQQNMQPFQQLGFLSDIYKGAPSTQMAMTQQTQAQASPFQQIAGLGVAGVSAAAAGAKAGLF